MRQFFMQLSEPIYQLAVEKLFKTVTTQLYLKSLKEVLFKQQQNATKDKTKQKKKKEKEKKTLG